MCQKMKDLLSHWMTKENNLKKDMNHISSILFQVSIKSKISSPNLKWSSITQTTKWTDSTDHGLVVHSKIKILEDVSYCMEPHNIVWWYMTVISMTTLRLMKSLDWWYNWMILLNLSLIFLLHWEVKGMKLKTNLFFKWITM